MNNRITHAMIAALLFSAAAYAQDAPSPTVSNESHAHVAPDSPPPLNDLQRAEFFKIAFEIRNAEVQARNSQDEFERQVQASREKVQAANSKLVADANAKLVELTKKLAGDMPCLIEIDTKGEPAWKCTEEKTQ